MHSTTLKDSARIQMLEWQDGIIDVVLDTDAATEVDDPFAISYLLLSPERFTLKAIYAAPFAMNERAQDPADGMEMSYQEILHIMRLCHREGCCSVLRGSSHWMKKDKTPVHSDAAEDLICRAMNYTKENPLYVIAIGAATNIASALQKCPQIMERIVIIWLAGNEFHDTPNAYNIYQDIAAAQVVFDSGAPLIHVPCDHVTSHMLTSVPELEYCIGNKNTLCEYLIHIVKEYHQDHFAWGKQIWDLGAIGCMVNRNWRRMEYTDAPIITDQLTWCRDSGRHLIGNIRSLDRDAIFRDAFLKMGAV